MENTGLVAVGHLLANKSPDNYFKSMRHFCTLIFCNMDDKQIHKSSGFWRFDQFFKSVDINIESFGKFVNGILRRTDTDVFQLQLQIERLAWDIVKFDFDKHINLEAATVVNRLNVYRLFCLFNRFCSRNAIPMTLNERAAIFFCKELGIPIVASPSPVMLSFSKLVSHVSGNVATLKAKAIKRMYDEFVRDVIKEGRVRYRVMEGPLAAAGTVILNNSKIRTHTVTSRHLCIYDDNEDPDQPHDIEPTGTVLQRIPLIDIETKVVNAKFNKNRKYLHLVSKSKSKETASIEMTFDIVTDNFDLYSWSQAVQEAVHSTKVNNTRLSKAYARLRLVEAESGLVNNRNSEPLSPPPSTSTFQGGFHLGTVMPERCKSSADLKKDSPLSKRPSPPPPMRRRSNASSNCSSDDASPMLRRALISGMIEKSDKMGDEEWKAYVLKEVAKMQSRAC
jgi:hypothetical protein